MNRYPNLAGLDCLSIVLFNNGMGGQFLANTLNLADLATQHDQLQPWVAHSMHNPVTGYADGEQNYQWQTTKYLWWGLFVSSCATQDLELFFGDCESRLLASICDFSAAAHDSDYWLQRKPLSKIKSIYVSGHVHPHCADPRPVLDAVSAYAAEQGIGLRYIVCTVNSANQTWAWRRGQDTTAGSMDQMEWLRQYQLYVRCLDNPAAVPLALDDLIQGRCDSFAAQLESLIMSDSSQVSAVADRVRAFYQLKISPSWPASPGHESTP